MPHEADFQKLLDLLWSAYRAHKRDDIRALVGQAIEHAEVLKVTVTKAAVKRGRKGGTKTAERGPDYFRQIAAMRKTKAGGRPKNPTSPQSRIIP